MPKTPVPKLVSPYRSSKKSHTADPGPLKLPKTSWGRKLFQKVSTVPFSIWLLKGYPLVNKHSNGKSPEIHLQMVDFPLLCYFTRAYTRKKKKTENSQPVSFEAWSIMQLRTPKGVDENLHGREKLHTKSCTEKNYKHINELDCSKNLALNFFLKNYPQGCSRVLLRYFHQDKILEYKEAAP